VNFEIEGKRKGRLRKFWRWEKKRMDVRIEE
jgi:hypothetical protein